MLKRLLKSMSAIVAGQLLNIVGNLTLVPLFLSHWSTGVYGEWMALSAVVAYFGVSDLGMNAAAGNVLTAAYASEDMKRYRYLQGSAMAFYVVMAFSLSLILAILIAFLPIPAWIGIRQIPASIAAPVIWILAATVLWQMPASLLRCVYRTTGNLAATQWYWNLQFGGGLAATVIVLTLHGGILSLALWNAVPAAIVTTAIWLSLRRSYPELLPKLSEARIEGLRELLGPSLLFGLIMLSSALTLQGPVILVSMFLGGTAVALFVTTRTLTNILRQVTNALQNALWPELTRMGAVGAEETIRFGHRLYAISAVTITAAFAGALWFEGGSVISIWTGGKLTPDIWLLRFLLIALVLQAPWLASSLFTQANNRHRYLAFSYVLSAIFTLTAIALLLRSLGLVAVPLGAIIAEGLVNYHFVVKDACKVIGENYARYAMRIWFGVVVISCAAWGAGYLGHAIAIGPAPARWIEVGVMTTLAAILAAWGVALRKKDRSHLVIWGNARLTSFRGATVKHAA